MDVELQIQLLKTDIENDFNLLKEHIRAKILIDKHGVTTFVFWGIYEFAKRSGTIIHAISNQLILVADTLEHIDELYIRNSK